MKKITKISILLFCCIIFSNNDLFSQKVGFISTDQIRESLPEAKSADQRIQTIIDEWKREERELDQQIEAKEFEIQKNRLIWTENERIQNNNELRDLKNLRMNFSKEKYSVNGEYEQIVYAIQKPVEEKIFAAVQKVAAELNIDIIWDKSTQPLIYTNFKYDITVKVLKELGVNTSELEAELNKKIEMDPRNSPDNQSKETPTRRTRQRRTDSKEDTKDKPQEANPAVSPAAVKPISDQEILRPLPPTEKKPD